MKKTYMKPEARVHQLPQRGIFLLGSKGFYGKVKIGDDEQQLNYGGHVTEDNEDTFDPD